MKAAPRKSWVPLVGASLGVLLASLPMAAQDSAPNPADTPVGLVFRWLNFALVFGGLAYLVGKFGGPYFRGNAESIANSIRQAAEVRAAAERELKEAEERLAGLELEVKDMRRAAVRESAAETERIRELARVETGKIQAAVAAEIEAAERYARQELRAMTARMATEQAAAMLRSQITPAAESALFRSFVGELERSAS
jgi:F0F1-type ATP synthase membrane subunit b/b'